MNNICQLLVDSVNSQDPAVIDAMDTLADAKGMSLRDSPDAVTHYEPVIVWVISNVYDTKDLHYLLETDDVILKLITLMGDNS